MTPQLQPSRVTLTSTGSILLHAAIVAALLVGSYLHVDPLAHPAIAEPFLRFDPPVGAAAAALAAPAGSDGSVAVRRIDVEVAPEPAPDRLQPEDPAESAAVDAPARGGEPAAEPDSDAGAQGGGPGWVQGGVPGGDPDGVPGGDPDGMAGGERDGVPFGLPGDALAAPGAQADLPVYLSGEITPPERVEFVKPLYPEIARLSRTPGKVILEVVVGRAGEIESVKVLRSDPLFDDAAVQAVSRWRYRPALQSGRTVRVFLTVVIEFALS